MLAAIVEAFAGLSHSLSKGVDELMEMTGAPPILAGLGAGISGGLALAGAGLESASKFEAPSITGVANDFSGLGKDTMASIAGFGRTLMGSGVEQPAAGIELVQEAKVATTSIYDVSFNDIQVPTTPVQGGQSVQTGLA